MDEGRTHRAVPLSGKLHVSGGQEVYVFISGYWGAVSVLVDGFIPNTPVDASTEQTDLTVGREIRQRRKALSRR